MAGACPGPTVKEAALNRLGSFLLGLTGRPGTRRRSRATPPPGLRQHGSGNPERRQNAGPPRAASLSEALPPPPPTPVSDASSAYGEIATAPALPLPRTNMAERRKKRLATISAERYTLMVPASKRIASAIVQLLLRLNLIVFRVDRPPSFGSAELNIVHSNIR